jgi:hypothetical protein
MDEEVGLKIYQNNECESRDSVCDLPQQLGIDTHIRSDESQGAYRENVRPRLATLKTLDNHAKPERYPRVILNGDR